MSNFKISVPVVSWVDFCDEDLMSLIRHTTLSNKDKFVPTTVSTGEANFRQSVVLWDYHWPELYRRFINRIEQVLPAVKDQMGDYCFQCAHSGIEAQLTMHYRNGDHFRVHVDNGSRATAGRRISYVVYFRLTDEQQFTGGELNLHFQNGIRTVQPVHNSVIFFPSHLYHEVCPVQSATELFEHGRGTVNGWISTNAEDAG